MAVCAPWGVSAHVATLASLDRLSLLLSPVWHSGGTGSLTVPLLASRLVFPLFGLVYQEHVFWEPLLVNNVGSKMSGLRQQPS